MKKSLAILGFFLLSNLIGICFLMGSAFIFNSWFFIAPFVFLLLGFSSSLVINIVLYKHYKLHNSLLLAISTITLLLFWLFISIMICVWLTGFLYILLSSVCVLKGNCDLATYNLPSINFCRTLLTL